MWVWRVAESGLYDPRTTSSGQWGGEGAACGGAGRGGYLIPPLACRWERSLTGIKLTIFFVILECIGTFFMTTRSVTFVDHIFMPQPIL